jgi:hypothetical protein
VHSEESSSGRKRQAAPVCRIQRIPSNQAQSGTGVRSRLSCRGLRFGSNGSINSHCSSVSSFRRFFVAEAQQLTCLTHGYLM